METDMRLAGKKALVTGGGKRLGREVALALAREGASVVVHYGRSSDGADETAAEIRRLGVKAWTVRTDLASEAKTEKLVDRAAALSGGLDILVNNASIFPEGEFEDLSAADLHRNVDVNALAPFVLGRNFARQAGGGHIVNFLDTRITGYDWQHAAYHASKILLAYLTRVMALRFAPSTAVNAVAPGLILPPEGKDAAYLNRLKDTVPLRRVGNPAQITQAVIYLVTSAYLTGQVIFVDGGRHLLGGWPPAP
jgi:pteridine reductase